MNRERNQQENAYSTKKFFEKSDDKWKFDRISAQM
jgi:hypothetical protein